MSGLDLSLQVTGGSVRANCLLRFSEATTNAGALHMYPIFRSGQQITYMFIQCYSDGGGRRRDCIFLYSWKLHGLIQIRWLCFACFNCLSRDNTARSRQGWSSPSLIVSWKPCWTELQNKISQSFLTDYCALWVGSRYCHLTKPVNLKELSKFLYISELPNQEHILQ